MSDNDHTHDSNATPAPPKQMHFGWLLLISFVLFNLSFIVDQTVRWTNHFQGLINGTVHVLFFGIAWCVYCLPWSLVIFALYGWRKWKRFRTPWVLAPAVLALIVSIGALVFQPPTPSKRFKNFAKTDLPANAQNLHYHFSGGGIADYADTYYFETTPDQVDRIIAEMRLTEDTLFSSGERKSTSISPLPDAPDFRGWEGARQYQGSNEKETWFYYLITDDSRTKVYMLIGCI